MISNHRELTVWQKAFGLAAACLAVTESFERGSRRSLGEQIRRTAVSVPSNIAEGNGRATRRDYLRFLSIANGSLAELDTQLRLARHLRYMTTDDGDGLLAACAEVGRLLGGLMRALRAPPITGASATRGAAT